MQDSVECYRLKSEKIREITEIISFREITGFIKINKNMPQDNISEKKTLSEISVVFVK